MENLITKTYTMCVKTIKNREVSNKEVDITFTFNKEGVYRVYRVTPDGKKESVWFNKEGVYRIDLSAHFKQYVTFKNKTDYEEFESLLNQFKEEFKKEQEAILKEVKENALNKALKNQELRNSLSEETTFKFCVSRSMRDFTSTMYSIDSEIEDLRDKLLKAADLHILKVKKLSADSCFADYEMTIKELNNLYNLIKEELERRAAIAESKKSLLEHNRNLENMSIQELRNCGYDSVADERQLDK